MAAQSLFSFVAGNSGDWLVSSMTVICGDGLQEARSLSMVRGDGGGTEDGAIWVLRGVTSNLRYTTGAERTALVNRQAGLGRPEARCAALIPISKNAQWWQLAQDERRRIFEETSHHIEIGYRYLPAVARQLHHCRDLGEPFDFLTWFEYDASDEAAFDELVGRLRETEEWRYIDREVDIRLIRDGKAE
ncbi:MAG: chlorite dismutase family protein [Pseudorhodoplanes sp.]